MAEEQPERARVDARIVYWGVEGSGKSTNLEVIHAKLRPDHRGRLEQIPTRLDPTVVYDRLPIELGEIAGVRTRLQIVAVPGAAEHGPTRKQLLDRVDGLVLVVDARPSRIDENLAAFEELRSALAAYGRSLEEVPLVVQYNHLDGSDPYVLEELHRKLDVRGAAVFEAVAHEGTGVLQTLTTISKRVVRTLRETGAPAAAVPPAAPRESRPAAQAPARIATPTPAPAPARPPVRSPAVLAAAPAPPDPASPARVPLPAPDLEAAALAAGDDFDDRDALLSRAQGLLDASWPELTGGHEAEVDALETFEPAPDALRDAAAAEGTPGWRIVSARAPHVEPGGRLVVPVTLADETGRELTFRLALEVEVLLDASETGRAKG